MLKKSEIIPITISAGAWWTTSFTTTIWWVTPTPAAPSVISKKLPSQLSVDIKGKVRKKSTVLFVSTKTGSKWTYFLLAIAKLSDKQSVQTSVHQNVLKALVFKVNSWKISSRTIHAFFYITSTMAQNTYNTSWYEYWCLFDIFMLDISALPWYFLQMHKIAITTSITCIFFILPACGLSEICYWRKVQYNWTACKSKQQGCQTN